MDFLLSYQWEIFITIEVMFFVFLLLFGFVRYFLHKPKLSLCFLGGFLILLLIEALLAFLVYRVTGDISTFQIVIAIFVLYAVTFGIFDFLKLDRWMRQKIGAWRGIDLLTEKDVQRIEQHQNPQYIARKYRISSTVHLIIFMIGQTALWMHGTESLSELFSYLQDLSWMDTGEFADSPYANEATYSIGMLWMIIFFIDFVWSWSYTFFPAKK